MTTALLRINIEAIAKVAHEANRAYCATLGDDSQPAWEDAPDWQKSSALHGARFHVENPTAPASASHTSWLAEKEATGWKYGPVKDPDKKEHPCYVPFEELSEEHKRKDFLFRAVVHALADPI